MFGLGPGPVLEATVRKSRLKLKNSLVGGNWMGLVWETLFAVSWIDSWGSYVGIFSGWYVCKRETCYNYLTAVRVAKSLRQNKRDRMKGNLIVKTWYVSFVICRLYFSSYSDFLTVLFKYGVGFVYFSFDCIYLLHLMYQYHWCTINLEFYPALQTKRSLLPCKEKAIVNQK